METSHWSRSFKILSSDWLLRQLSHAIKTQLEAPKAPYEGHFLPFAVSLCIRVASMQGKDLLEFSTLH